MRKALTCLVVLLLVAVLAGSAWAGGWGKHWRRVDKLRVLTLNFYVGADLLTANEPSPCGALQSVNKLYEDILASDPVGRAEAHADLIWLQRPHVIALQEMYLIRTQFPSNSYVFDGSDFDFDNFEVNVEDSPPTITFTPDAQEVVFDYLTLLLEALDNRGLKYDVIQEAKAMEADFEFPSWDLVPDPDLGFCVPADGAPPLPTDVRATDYDVLLVRSDVSYANGTASNYQAFVPFRIPTGTEFDVRIDILRGFGAADITYRGHTTRVVNTHLEVDDQSDPNSPINVIQAWQAAELIQTLAAESLPLVVTGDFNSSPDPEDVTTSYELIVEAGYKDIWTQSGRRRRPGYTCCQAADLLNLESELSKRIDLIFLRLPDDADLLRSPVWITGNRQWQKTDSGLWPSDHASVGAWIRIKR